MCARVYVCVTVDAVPGSLSRIMYGRSGSTFECGFLKVLKVWMVLLAVSPALAGYTSEKSMFTKGSAKPAFPAFDVIIREIDANVGETVLLPCTVRNLGDKVVSWIRTRDLSILTSGPHTFSADSRYEAVSSQEADFFGLRIRGVRPNDTGRYECQVNTDPKINLAVTLSVGVKQPAGMSFKYTSVARITSPREVYTRVGSPVSLTCEISPASGDEPLLLSDDRVKWLHDNRPIISEADRSGVSVDTDYRDKKITSRLRVAMVTTQQDQGVYTCSRAGAKEDSIKVFVYEGEHTEAMQRDAAFYSSSNTPITTHFLIILFLLLRIT